MIDLKSAGVPTVTTTTVQLAPPLTTPQLIQSVTNLLTEPSPQKYYQELTRVVAQVMNADYCLLLMPPKTGEQLIVPVGYNRADDRMIDGFASDGHKMPSILEAVRSGKNLLLSINQEAEGRVLADQLGLKQAAKLMMVPFHPKGSSAVMAIGCAVCFTNQGLER